MVHKTSGSFNNKYSLSDHTYILQLQDIRGRREYSHDGVTQADCEYQAPDECPVDRSGTGGVVISGVVILLGLCLMAL